jgi:multiple sugar transport system permease protein
MTVQTSPLLDRQNRRQRVRSFLDRHDRHLLPAPAVLIVVLLLAFPVVFTAYLSFHSWSGGVRPPQVVGLETYLRAATDPRFWGGIGRTLYFVGLAVGLQVILGVAAALVFHRRFLLRGAVRALYLFPMTATPAAMALVWKMMFDPTLGVLSYLSESVGGPPVTWTSDPNLVIPALALIDSWQWTPLVMLICLAGLAALPLEPFEAARVDGGSEWRILWSITIPLLLPVIIVAAMFRLIDCVKTFDIILIVTAGGPGYSSETLNLYAFNTALPFLNFGYGSTLLVWLGIMVFAIAVVLSAARRRHGGAQ